MTVGGKRRQAEWIRAKELSQQLGSFSEFSKMRFHAPQPLDGRVRVELPTPYIGEDPAEKKRRAGYARNSSRHLPADEPCGAPGKEAGEGHADIPAQNRQPVSQVLSRPIGA